MKVTIRPLAEDDAYTSVRWRNTPEIWAHTRSAPDREVTLTDELEWIRGAIADERSHRFAILAEGTYVGNAYLTGIENGVAEFHIFIGDRSHWGRGVARGASEATIAYGRDVLTLRAIVLEVHEDNLAAVSLYRALGFVHTGTAGRFLSMRLELAR